MEHHLRNPYQRAIVTLAGIAGFALLATLAIWGISFFGLANPALIGIGLIFFIVVSLMLTIIWLLGLRQVGRARAFLASDRPLVRWTYSQAEWDQLKESLWREEKGDWKVQWGCLTVLLALAGLLTEVMLGWEDGFFDVIISGSIGLVLGGLAGAVLGMLVAGGNYVGARQSHKQTTPGQVALGVDEIYASGEYFKGKGRISYIREVQIHRGNPSTLEFLLIFPPQPRMPTEEDWHIPIPAKWVEPVEEILPRLAPNSQV